MNTPSVENILDLPPYAVSQVDKEKYLLTLVKQLTSWHMLRCDMYRAFVSGLAPNGVEILSSLESVPFLPVDQFKVNELLSVGRDQVVKVMTSSGTSGQAVSKIFLDRNTARFQSICLKNIMRDILGPRRLPMLIIDSPSVLRDRSTFSARGAGILGFSAFGYKPVYALDDNFELDLDAVLGVIESSKDTPIFLFGFTFMIWEYLILPLERKGIQLDLGGSILLHGGGWKKLADRNIHDEEFKARIYSRLGLISVKNYYGMVEQTGSIFAECEHGVLHASSYADVVVRGDDLLPVNHGETGALEVISALPLSYPGHVLLTEDVGAILGVDDCPCGRLGKYFRVSGRLEKSEIRGCSDTHEN